MKWIKYVLTNGAEKALSYSEDHLTLANQEANNGEYTIADDETAETLEEG